MRKNFFILLFLFISLTGKAQENNSKTLIPGPHFKIGSPVTGLFGVGYLDETKQLYYQLTADFVWTSDIGATVTYYLNPGDSFFVLGGYQTWLREKMKEILIMAKLVEISCYMVVID